ncbi:hypothetical protein HMPREF6485_1085 [Segatella buccae ATCC 33574]|uniref:Uncharacterized protein n=1 Tax=Segatella buccae ATCC 33574 TaxID=873513 RepID=E6K649_9BACT|nr:hypothetical protein HMPREF6485_1085 [Segatella buccae ATCC 33574]
MMPLFKMKKQACNRLCKTLDKKVSSNSNNDSYPAERLSEA